MLLSGTNLGERVTCVTVFHVVYERSVVAVSSLAMISGDCSTILSLPAG